MPLHDEVATGAPAEGSSSRRSALAALAAGAALGLGSLGGGAEAARNKNKGKDKNRDRKKGRGGKKGGHGKNKGHGNGNGGGNGNGKSNDAHDKKLPAVQYVVNENEIDVDGDFTGVAECPDGYLPINGGISVDASAFDVVSSTPNAEDGQWEVEVSDAAEVDTLRVFAVCLEARDETPREERLELAGERRQRSAQRRGGRGRNGKGRGRKR